MAVFHYREATDYTIVQGKDYKDLIVEVKKMIPQERRPVGWPVQKTYNTNSHEETYWVQAMVKNGIFTYNYTP